MEKTGQAILPLRKQKKKTKHRAVPHIVALVDLSVEDGVPVKEACYQYGMHPTTYRKHKDALSKAEAVNPEAPSLSNHFFLSHDRARIFYSDTPAFDAKDKLEPVPTPTCGAKMENGNDELPIKSDGIPWERSVTVPCVPISKFEQFWEKHARDFLWFALGALANTVVLYLSSTK